SDDARFFVDKSPYSLIASEVIDMFPDAKFVFLWRNPLGVVASMMETWGNGQWYPTMYRGDLFIGLPRLVAAFTHNRDRVHAVRFEDLVRGGQEPWEALMQY